jgi:transposase
MAKHDERFRLLAVERYLEGRGGLRIVSRELDVEETVLRRWVARYRQHGLDGLSRKYTFYDADFKLAVLKRVWDEQLSHHEAMAIFNIRQSGAIARWERQYHSGGIDALAPRRRGRPKAMKPPEDKPKTAEDQTPDERTREQLLKENEYLRAEVAYLKKLDALVQAKKLAQRKRRK